jgi:hypothetical protein
MKMAKQIFLQKNGKGGGKSPLRLLLWPAIGLMVLFLLVTLFMRPNDETDLARRLPPGDKGAIVKEMPRPPAPAETIPAPAPQAETPQMDGNGLASAPQAQPTEPPMTTTEPPSTALNGLNGKVPETAPPALNGINGKVAESVPPAPSAVQPPEPPVASREWIQPGAAPSQPATPPAAMKETESAPLPPALAEQEPKAPVKPAQPKATASLPPGAGKYTKVAPIGGKSASVTGSGASGEAAAKPKAPAVSGKGTYTVRVGSFKDKQNADEIKNNLQKRGYEVMVTTTQNPKLGQLYVVQLKPVASIGTAHTMVEQIKNEEKVKPIIVPVNASETSAQ